MQPSDLVVDEEGGCSMYEGPVVFGALEEEWVGSPLLEILLGSIEEGE